MSFTYVNSNENGTSSGTTLAVNVTGVHAGDLIVVAVGTFTLTATITVSDGTSSLTPLTLNSTVTANSQMFYLLSSVASGTVTYTATFSVSSLTMELHVWVYTPSAAASFDVERADQTANSASVTTGNITTTGTDEVVVAAAYTQSGNTGSSININAIAADHNLNPGGHMQSWTKVFAATFTGAGTETITGTNWNANIASFKIAAAGSASITPTVGALAGSGGASRNDRALFPLPMVRGT